MLNQKITYFLLVFALCGILCAEENMRAMSDDTTERVYEIEERLDSVERATLIDRVKLSLDYRLTVNNYFYSEKSSEDLKGEGLIIEDGETLNLWNMRGRIKLKSQLLENLGFIGWLTMYKQFLESSPDRYRNNSIAPTYDMSRGYYPGDSSIYLERLFLDWTITRWMIFSVGRSPNADGIPADVRYDAVAYSTFPEGGMTSPLDIAFLSFPLNPLFGLYNSFLRFAIVPKVLMEESIPNNVFVDTELESQNYFMTQLDLQVPGVDRSRVMIQGAYSPEIKTGSAQADLDGDGIKEDLFVPKTLGRFWYGTFAFLFKQPYSIPFDLFFTASYSYIIPETRTSENENVGFIGIDNGPSNRKTPLLSMLGGDLDGKGIGGLLLYAGFLYHTPLKLYNKSVGLGFDANFNQENFYFFFAPDTTGLNRFGMRGQHYETYVMIPIHRKANIRIGYIYEHHTNPWGLVYRVGQGIPDIDERIHNVHAMMNIYF